MKRIAKVILLNQDNEMLFQLRDNKPGIVAPNEWALIGGGIKHKETALQGLQREIQEEIPGCLIRDIKFIGRGYVEFDENLMVKSYSIKEHKLGSSPLIHNLEIFSGRIYNNLGYINSVLREGQRTDFFIFKELEKVNFFAKEFITENKYKIFI